MRIESRSPDFKEHASGAASVHLGEPVVAPLQMVVGALVVESEQLQLGRLGACAVTEAR